MMSINYLFLAVKTEGSRQSVDIIDLLGVCTLVNLPLNSVPSMKHLYVSYIIFIPAEY